MTNDQILRIITWLNGLSGLSHERVPFTVPDWAVCLVADPYGGIYAHVVTPCPQTWHGDGVDCPLWTSDEWWQDQGRVEMLYKFTCPLKCDYVWDARFDLST
jgi:hypothetical protein